MKQLRRSTLLLLLALSLAAMFWACSEDPGNNVASPEPENDLLAAVQAHQEEFEQAIAIHNRAVPGILSTKGIVGTAIGADDNGLPVVKIYTSGPIAKGPLPQDVGGLPIVIEETGPIKAYKGGGGGGSSGQAKQTPPVKMGTSGGWRFDLANGFCCGGTLGSLVQKGGTKYVLSNYHVLYADIVNGGNSRTAQAGDPVIQPGLIDVACNANTAQNIASLVANGGTLPDPGNPDAVDAAIASVTSGMVDETGSILNVGTISATTRSAAVGLAVKKMGRTTGLTRSTISGINGAFSIQYENECAGGASFVQSYSGQIVISNRRCGFQNGGDSGSLLVEDVTTNPRAVGLCFAGSVTCNNSAIAIANPIGDVLSKLGATMVGQ
ncbi:MAG TPA: hypothetical protein VEC56_02120 [Candidatus Krumholzibacteria bacterium]|nr:hypothetical protein [Candidatus Krumholzibacteria bacterium]